MTIRHDKRWITFVIERSLLDKYDEIVAAVQAKIPASATVTRSSILREALDVALPILEQRHMGKKAKKRA